MSWVSEVMTFLQIWQKIELMVACSHKHSHSEASLLHLIWFLVRVVLYTEDTLMEQRQSSGCHSHLSLSCNDKSKRLMLCGCVHAALTWYHPETFLPKTLYLDRNPHKSSQRVDSYPDGGRKRRRGVYHHGRYMMEEEDADSFYLKSQGVLQSVLHTTPSILRPSIQIWTCPARYKLFTQKTVEETSSGSCRQWDRHEDIQSLLLHLPSASSDVNRGRSNMHMSHMTISSLFLGPFLSISFKHTTETVSQLLTSALTEPQVNTQERGGFTAADTGDMCVHFVYLFFFTED